MKRTRESNSKLDTGMIRTAAGRIWNSINGAVQRLDGMNLWWVGLIVLAVLFSPYVILREGSVFEIHDQLDETLLTYVLSARHLGSGTSIFPEMLGGVNASGMQPSAVLFLPLYRFLPAFAAFMIQFFTVCAAGYFGMYFCVRELTKSSILAVLAAGMFVLLPIQPVYGLSVLGVPLLAYAFLCFYQRKHLALSVTLTVFFGLTTHLVLIGYVALSFWALASLIMFFRKKHNAWIYGGFVLLTAIYVVVNFSLFVELLLGQGSYVSHREELVNYGSPVWESIRYIFLNSGQHAVSLHKYLILPIIAVLVIWGLCYRRLDQRDKDCFRLAAGIFVLLVLIAVFYGICKSIPVTEWKNSMSGFLRYFQAERYYWLYPSLWYVEAALAGSLFLRSKSRILPWIVKLSVIAVALLPTLHQLKISSYLYMNVNQINNGSQVTGYISWESYYAEDLMQQLEEAIGREKSDYRVAHLGISPAPSLMHGFYTVDGYSNNYSLEYKHRFRRVIAAELDENEAARIYFDGWGSRCYLFNRESGTYWMIGKLSHARFERLLLDMEQLKGLGCEYLFSGGEIENAAQLGLECMGYFETQDSYWGIWLYRLL